MRYTLKQCIQQIKERIHYEGSLEIGEVKFIYKIIIASPIEIEQMRTLKHLPLISLYRNAFQIFMRHADGTEIGLSDVEYIIFFKIFTDALGAFMNTPLIVEANKRLKDNPSLEEEVIAHPELFPYKGEIVLSYFLNHEIISILNHPKFNCGLDMTKPLA